jgi:N-acetylglucosaminyldiphosphoundecaprenol N-acetyl-beta-D-mannosaminyltransferase
MFNLTLNRSKSTDGRSLLASGDAPSTTQEPVGPLETEDLAREVYGILGMPIDALDRVSVLKKIVYAAETKQTFLLATPNVNFLMMSLRDVDFRESLMHSDLCAADGMPIIWLSRLLGIPINERVSGSDLFDLIRTNGSVSNPLRVFLVGGGEGVAEKVCGILNSRPSGIHCVGWLNPGFGTVAEMSGEDTIAAINGSNADLLAVFFSARKAQAWLLHNHARLRVPVRGQFGATINYQAGTVRRAPRILQRLGFEWLWRIKEEPYLWRRYLRDGISLINLVVFRILQIAAGLWWRRRQKGELVLTWLEDCNSVVVTLVGHATKAHIAEAIVCFRRAINSNRQVVIDVSKTETIDPRFFGLLLMLRRGLAKSGRSLSFRGQSKRIVRLFRLHQFAFLLETT